MDFERLAETALGPGRAPFAFQARFAQADTLPSTIRVPTGLGKTATIVLGWVWRLGAHRVGRRHGAESRRPLQVAEVALALPKVKEQRFNRVGRNDCAVGKKQLVGDQRISGSNGRCGQPPAQHVPNAVGAVGFGSNLGDAETGESPDQIIDVHIAPSLALIRKSRRRRLDVGDVQWGRDLRIAEMAANASRYQESNQSSIGSLPLQGLANSG